MSRLLLVVLLVLAATSARAELTVGSKKFTESVLLGEIVAGLLRADGADVRHRQQLGGTRVLWQALLAGDVDIYPEYTGTLREEIFAGEPLADLPALEARLAEEGIGLVGPLGFDNSYGLGVTAATAAALGLQRISDLGAHPQLRLGFSNEFVDRPDGWPALRDRYGLSGQRVRGMDHDLAYRALADGAIDVTDLYTTDAEIAHYGLTVLTDDLSIFPEYAAVLLYRLDTVGGNAPALAGLARLQGAIDADTMIAMNGRVKLDGLSEAKVAAGFLATDLGVAATVNERGLWARIGARSVEHIAMVAVSLGAAIAVALPLGVIASRRPRLGQLILGATGVLQTIPALALLVFMIPLLGIGAAPAVVALFLYSLLPIVRNTHSGIKDIPLPLRESALALGLPRRAILLRIELPLAARSILAGIKTAAVINIGTATLGALIGAGGYGQPILTGIRLDDTALILEGALPAALLALATQALFDVAERRMVPRGLRLADREP